MTVLRSSSSAHYNRHSMLARIRQILTDYDTRYEQLYLDDTTVRYNCNIVALSLTNAEEIERKIDSIEKKIDTCVI